MSKFDKFVESLEIEKHTNFRFEKNINFSLFVNILLQTVYGYVDDAHSYLYENGIMAVTLTGVKNNNSK